MKESEHNTPISRFGPLAPVSAGGGQWSGLGVQAPNDLWSSEASQTEGRSGEDGVLDGVVRRVPWKQVDEVVKSCIIKRRASLLVLWSYLFELSFLEQARNICEKFLYCTCRLLPIS